MKIFFRLPARGLVHAPIDPDLTLELHPVEGERRTWIRLQLARLRTGVVRVENEAAVTDCLQKDNATRRCSVSLHGRETHRVYVANFGRCCFAEPLCKLLDWIRIELRATEAVRLVLMTQ